MTWGALKSLSILYPHGDWSSKDHKEGILSVCCNKWLLALSSISKFYNPECKKHKTKQKEENLILED